MVEEPASGAEDRASGTNRSGHRWDDRCRPGRTRSISRARDFRRLHGTASARARRARKLPVSAAALVDQYNIATPPAR